MIKAVVFDLDGTLLDTIEDIGETCNIVLKELGHHPLDVKDYKIYVGKGVKHLVEKVFEHRQIDESSFNHFINRYYEVYQTQSSVFTKPYPGIMSLLDGLKNMEISINVLSNKPHGQVIDLMPKYFPKHDFDLVYGKKEEFSTKPHPGSLRHMIKKLGLKKTEILYVGDTKTDMETALNAGVQSVGVLWGFRDETELVQAKASYIIRKPKELIQIIDNIHSENK